MMDEITRKKINLLAHLAKADGKFHAAEKKLLTDLFKGHNLFLEDAMLNDSSIASLDVDGILERDELLFLALKLIHVDGEVHQDEIAYCKALAIKLGFMPTIVDHFKDPEMLSLEAFHKLAGNYRFKV